MKLYSIQDVWQAEAAEESVAVPREVRAAFAKALEDAPGRVTYGTRQRAEALTRPHAPRTVVERVRAYFEAEADPSSPEYALHGGEVARAWFQKAEAAPAAEEVAEDHKDLRRRLGLLLGAHGDEGVPLAHLAEHVHRHGHKAVARALRDLGADHKAGRVSRRKPKKAPESTQETTQEAPERWRAVRFRGTK